MKDFNGTLLAPGDTVLTEQGKVLRVRESGMIYDMGSRIVTIEMRYNKRTGTLQPHGGNEVWHIRESLAKVDEAVVLHAFHEGDSLINLWYNLTFATRDALRERLRQQKGDLDKRAKARGQRRG